MRLRCIPACLVIAAQVGVDSDGGPGLGWVEDTEPSELYPYDMKLQEAMMGERLGLRA